MALAALSRRALAPACFLFVKDKLWYQNLPKIPFSSHPLCGDLGVPEQSCVKGWGAAQACTSRPHPLRLPSPPTSHFSLLSSRTRGLKCHSRGPAPSSCYKPIILVSMVTASSPWLHTNCHGHAVALPTASAVGHVRVRAIISPTQAWGHSHRAGGDGIPPCCCAAPAPSPALSCYCALFRARRDDVRGSKARGTASLRGEEAKRSALPF